MTSKPKAIQHSLDAICDTALRTCDNRSTLFIAELASYGYCIVKRPAPGEIVRLTSRRTTKCSHSKS